MSTFRGVVQEFPNIRIDFFRPIPGMRPPRTCFLSHIHSDHLIGLETPSFHNCFIYCSAATREILLRLEKYPQRLNFQKGILEKPPKVTYKHLDKLLKPIPLETPTSIELEPGNHIQVTLFDANHCTGAVMFLIEGDNKAILYTGDIRSEPWFVNNLTRNPFLIEYTSGLKTLDCIYLDTSNIRNIPFPSKAAGLQELLQKVSKYPADTVFHFTAWTFGYEEIHVDEYKMRLYASLRGKPQDQSDDSHLSGPFLAHEGPALTGYKCGNTLQAGCLTSDTNVRLHSCEKGLHCDKLDDKTVWIRPIITRTSDGEIREVGVGGGVGDLTEHVKIDLNSPGMVSQFIGLFADTDDLVRTDIMRFLGDGVGSCQAILSLDDLGLDSRKANIPLSSVVEALARSVAENIKESMNPVGVEKAAEELQLDALPRLITFPYSRHSSYPELCSLVEVFNPRDLYPCTVDEVNWGEDVSMENLFGEYISPTTFRHDDEMRALLDARHMKSNSQQTHTTATSRASSPLLIRGSPIREFNTASWNWGSLENLDNCSQRHEARNLGTVIKDSLNSDGESSSAGSGLLFRSLSRDFANTAEQTQKAPTNQEALRRNSNSQPRAYDEVEEDILDSVQLVLEMTSGSAAKMWEISSEDILSTPPGVLNAISPGSASQNLRRKAIHDAVGGQLKRARLSYDDPFSSFSVADSNATPRIARSPAVVIEIHDDPDEEAAFNLGFEANDSAQDIDDLSDAKYGALNVAQEIEVEDSQPLDDPYVRDFIEYTYDFQDESFLDHDDEDNVTITRCKKCGHELWTVWMTQYGLCTGICCERHEDSPNLTGGGDCPYYEILLETDGEDDPNDRCNLGPDLDTKILSHPTIHYSDFAKHHVESLSPEYQNERNIVGDYIDYHPDAYDTLDEESDYRSEYDCEDSFIDDSSLHDSQVRNENEDGSTGEREDPVDYKAMLIDLQRKHTRLLKTHEGMVQDLVDSDYAYDSSSSEESYLLADADIQEIDDYGAILEDVRPPNPNIVEIVLSHAQGESQQSDISERRIQDRVTAFKAAAGDDWANISLVSTGDNHTHPEIEL